jgi:spermidine/putrescine-binding protein
LAAIFDAKYKGRMVWRNRGTEMINLMAKVLGISVDRPEHPRKWHLEPRDLKRVTDELIKAKQRVQPLWYTSNAEAIKMFAADEIDVGFNTSYVAQEVSKRGIRARALTQLKPGEQFPGYVDGICLVKGAAHRDAGMALIDWLTSFRGRQILFERDGYPSVDRGIIDWAIGAGHKDQMEARGVLDPAQMVPRLQLLSPPTDLQAWVDAFSTVRAA